MNLKSPYPYFGGKARVAAKIWQALGDVPNYVEPFFGGGSVLLARPAEHLTGVPLETVNDKDGYISCFWRAIKADARKVAEYADWPVNENDLHARHAWLVGQRESMTARLEGDPDWYDAKIAGWWVWGMSCYIGGEFCSGKGPWQQINGELVRLDGSAGLGVKRARVHLGGQYSEGQGIHSTYGKNHLYEWFDALQVRLKRVRVASGDWTRVMTDSVTVIHGLTGVVLDPPYIMDNREQLYTHDGPDIAAAARQWAIAHGDNPLLRIVYCGYDDGFVWPDGWRMIEWKPPGGYGSHDKGNRERERLYLSRTASALLMFSSCPSLTSRKDLDKSWR
ncbi:MAG: DNA adenine methylase [Chloroflexi bacterium]|nr:DNA adenine methylase [Chloroflexota bacterium]